MINRCATDISLTTAHLAGDSIRAEPSSAFHIAGSVTRSGLVRQADNPVMMRRLHLLALVLGALFIAPPGGLAQSDQLLLTGRIVDADSGEPIPYAHVGVAEEAIGTTTGYDGRFELKLPDYLAAASFSISCIGYETHRMPAEAFRGGRTVRLRPAVADLTEVVVMDGQSARNIVRRAARAIADNYPERPSRSQAFYRESLADEDGRFNYLAEGVLDVYKTSYRDARDGQTAVVQGRKINLLDPLDTAVHARFTSGHMAPHRFDFVKNREDFIDEAFLPVYRYRLERMTTYDDRPVYVIAFEPDPEAAAQPAKRIGRRDLLGRLTGGLVGGYNRMENTGKIEARLRGRVFIDKVSLAFIRAEFEVTEEGLGRRSDYPLYSGRWSENTYAVNYRAHGDRWVFSDAVREGLYSDSSRYTNEVSVTRVLDGRAEQIPYVERVGRDAAFVKLTGRYAEDFWREYNVAPMSEGLTEGMRQFELMRQSERVFTESYRDSIQALRDSLRLLELVEAGNLEPGSLAEPGPLAEDGPIDVIDERPPESGGDLALRASLGFGVHALPSTPPPLSIAYGASASEPELALSATADDRDYEAVAHWDIDLVLHRNAFVRYTTAFDLGSNTYGVRAIGLGAQANLTPRRRPIVLRAVTQYSRLRYYRTLGRAPLADSPLEIDGKKFKGDEVRLGYGSHRHDLSVSGELSVALRRGRALFARATYHYRLAERTGVWFKETGQVFRRDRHLPVSDEWVRVTSDDAPYGDAIIPRGTWSFSLGWVFD